jgi:DHA2 family methylenomycin A resistance protein-like MFS transporter
MLTVLCSALFMVWLDTTAVYVALPAIQTDLAASVRELEWVAAGYTLPFACLMLFAGDLGDRFGRRPVFLVGIALFTLASAGCAVSAGAGVLIACRLVQGAAGAVIMPVSLAVIADAIHDPGRRGRAVGIWSGMGSIGLAGGPIVGGLLVSHFGWASVFWVNVPIGVLVVLAGLRFVPANDPDRGRRLDLVGVVLFTVSIGVLTYALIQVSGWTWGDPRVITMLVLASVVLAAFVVWEARYATAPLLPLTSFRDSGFSLSVASGMVVFFALYGVLLYLSVFFQTFQGLSASDAGARLVPMTAAGAVIAPVSALWTTRAGARQPLACGCLLAGVGLSLLLRFDGGSGYGTFVVPFVLIGIGATLAVTPGTIAVLNAVTRGRAGVASAMSQTSRQVGGVLGIAALGTVVVDAFHDRLPGALAGLHLTGPQSASVANAFTNGGRFQGTIPAPLRAELTRRASAALADSIHQAMLLAAVLCLLVAVVVAVFMREKVADGATDG